MLLVVHPDAQQEIIEAADSYDERAEGLGDDQHFTDRVFVLAFVRDRRRSFYWLKRR